jgi:hypothetical protein
VDGGEMRIGGGGIKKISKMFQYWLAPENLLVELLRLVRKLELWGGPPKPRQISEVESLKTTRLGKRYHPLN